MGGCSAGLHDADGTAGQVKNVFVMHKHCSKGVLGVLGAVDLWR